MKTDHGGRGCDIVRILEETGLLLEMPPEAESKEEEKHEEEAGEESVYIDVFNKGQVV